MKITGKTQVLGIIGNPIEHSLSPVMQNQAISALNLDYIYIPFPVKNENLSAVLTGFLNCGIKGFNVTIPHKQTIIPLLSKISDIAKKIGAVNTVWLTEEGWQGTNTDIDGFIAPLQKLHQDWHHITPLILGNGGASRAVIVGCEKLGCEQINVIGRNWKKLKDFQNSWQDKALNIQININHWDNLANLLPQSLLIVNTTPLGMYPDINQSPLTQNQIQLINANHIIYDLIYTPSPSLLLQECRAEGAKVIDGTEMLVQQGAIAFKIWTKKSAPIEIMRQSLLSILQQKEI
jgi:shikimate dehydrogenase